MKIDDLLLDSNFFENLSKSRDYNRIIVDYFKKFSSTGSIAFNSKTLLNNSLRIDNCNKVWKINYYKNSNIKELIKTNLCHNKFCSNCKLVTQSSRMAKYIPELEPYNDKLYHFTFTAPNVDGVNLRFRIKHMAKCFKRLINYITLNKKIKGISYIFDSWGYLGAIRSLEITYKNDNYHPHYHVAFAFDSFKFTNINNVNSFSYKHGQLSNVFSDEEILIQKIWYLLINNEKVNKFNIDSLDLGYSCIIKKFKENDYAELFKYMTKEISEDHSIMSYNNFISLYYATYRIKQIQGYGIFYNITDDGDLDLIIDGYNNYLFSLTNGENPITLKEFLSKQDYLSFIEKYCKDNTNVLNKDLFGYIDINSDVKYISSKKYIQIAKKIQKEKRSKEAPCKTSKDL